MNSGWTTPPPPMRAATAGADGAAGLVPQPRAGDQGKLLRADGTWVTEPTNYLGGIAGASVPATASAAGDYYMILSAGTSQGKTWAAGERAIYEGTSGNWTQVANGYAEALSLPGGGSVTGAAGSVAVTSGGTNKEITFAQSGGERARIAPTTGNLLIGTTTDSGEKLNVSGAAKFAGSVTATGTLTVGGNIGGGNQLVGSFKNTGGNAYLEVAASASKAADIHVDGAGRMSIYTNATTGSLGALAAQFHPDQSTTLAGSLTVGGGATLQKFLTATATLDFPSIANHAAGDLTIAVTGAAVGDSVFLGLPASPDPAFAFNAFVSSANTVTVRAYNITHAAVDPASATYRVTVVKF